MTRINVIPPQDLTGLHLIAELKEINQLSGSFRKSIGSKKGIVDIPNSFTLNTGHVKFFYNKGLYLHKRFNKVKEELIQRGYNIQAEFNNEWEKNRRLDLYKDWDSTNEAKQIVTLRIWQRIQEKPHLYKVDILNYYNTHLKQYVH